MEHTQKNHLLLYPFLLHTSLLVLPLHTWPIALTPAESGEVESSYTVCKQMDTIWLPHLNKMSLLNTICQKYLHPAKSAVEQDFRIGEVCGNVSWTAGAKHRFMSIMNKRD